MLEVKSHGLQEIDKTIFAIDLQKIILGILFFYFGINRIDVSSVSVQDATILAKLIFPYHEANPTVLLEKIQAPYYEGTHFFTYYDAMLMISFMENDPLKCENNSFQYYDVKNAYGKFKKNILSEIDIENISYKTYLSEYEKFYCLNCEFKKPWPKRRTQSNSSNQIAYLQFLPSQKSNNTTQVNPAKIPHLG